MPDHALAVFLMSVLLAAGQGDTPRRVALHELTVPPGSLPATCALSRTTPVRVAGNTMRMPDLAGLGIPANPWIGTDAQLIASIRERVDGPVMMPDGPPLTARQSARYRAHLAEGVEEAYAAVYTYGESGNSDPHEPIVVYGLRFADARSAADGRNDTGKNSRIIRVAMGSLVAAVHGAGPCFDAVRAHVTSLAK